MAASTASVKNAIQALNAFLQLPESSQVLGQKYDAFQNVINFVGQHFEMLDKNQPVAPTQQTINEIKDAIGYLKAVILEYPLTQDLGKFIQTFCILILNWNNNLSKDKVIEHDVQLISRLSSMHFTLAEIIEYSKSLISKLRSYQNFALPAIELSRHYLQSQDAPGGSTTRPTRGPLLTPKFDEVVAKSKAKVEPSVSEEKPKEKPKEPEIPVVQEEKPKEEVPAPSKEEKIQEPEKPSAHVVNVLPIKEPVLEKKQINLGNLSFSRKV